MITSKRTRSLTMGSTEFIPHETWVKNKLRVEDKGLMYKETTLLCLIGGGGQEGLIDWGGGGGVGLGSLGRLFENPVTGGV